MSPGVSRSLTTASPTFMRHYDPSTGTNMQCIGKEAFRGSLHVHGSLARLTQHLASCRPGRPLPCCAQVFAGTGDRALILAGWAWAFCGLKSFEPKVGSRASSGVLGFGSLVPFSIGLGFFPSRIAKDHSPQARSVWEDTLTSPQC